MKKLFIFLVLALIFLTVFDGRDNHQKIIKKEFKEIENFKSNTEDISIFPDSYVEVETDTIIGQSFSTKITNRSLKASRLLLKGEKPNQYVQNFEADISVCISQEEIFKLNVTADNFELKENDSFWKNATLQHSWVEQDLSTEENLVMKISFLNPHSNYYKMYQLEVEKDGKHKLKLVEENYV
ncbi:hypothetical protein SAMN03097699_1199 [Flavobacteriaceae bacterium MAR_2010_188]|nr:hypothetical protein SAMN03097699_1199 [Flavobacteriaceae bacterium MAR_2010_188]